MNVNRLALTAAIALALTATPAFGWDDKECEDWLKTHPGNPHPDCVQATPTPRPHHEKTPTPVPQPTNTPQPQPTATQQPPTITPTHPSATATPTQPPSTECIPCGEADAPTPMPPLGPAGPNSPAVLAAVIEVAPTVAPQATRPVQVLAAGPTLLPFTGDALPYVASLLLGLGMTIGGWLMRRGS